MNQPLRTLLIDKAKKGKTVSYEEAAQQIKLDMGLPHHRDEMSKRLGELSTYEHEQARPLLSALVVHKNSHEQGKGFFELAEWLGFGKAQKLVQDLFGVTEIDKCHKFWSDPKNQAFITLPITQSTHSLNFFDQTDFDLMWKWGDQKYDAKNNEHQQAREQIKDTCWVKSRYWASEIAKQMAEVVDYSVAHAVQQGQKFTPYTWVRLVRPGHKNRGVHFGVGIGSDRLLYCQLHYKYSGDLLTDAQKTALEQYIQKHQLWVNRISIKNHTQYDWDKLITETRDYIKAHLPDYDHMISLISKDWLFKQDSPKSFPPPPDKTNRSFAGREDVDYEAQTKHNKSIGDAGEDLVIAWEKQKLLDTKRPDLAEKVCKQLDGVGYDVLSYDKDGKEMHIEVKTTTGGATTPFDMTINEREFARLHPENYYLYRLYNYNQATNSAEFYITEDLHNNAEFVATNFKVYPKK